MTAADGWALEQPGDAHPQCRAVGVHVCAEPGGDDVCLACALLSGGFVVGAR